MKVYFNGNFWGGHKFEHAGKELPIKKEFWWGGLSWHIPAIYSCSKGLVIDFCVGVSREKIEKYLDHWNREKRISGLSEEEYELMEKENPFTIDFEVEAKINENELGHSRMCATNWHPCDSEREQIEDIQEELMEYYACDRSQGWRFIRVCYPWTTTRKPKLKTLSLLLKERPVRYAGEHFVTDEFCDRQEMKFIHPVSKKEHCLKLYGCETNTLPADAFSFKKDMEYPTIMKVLTYSISPELSPKEFGIQDCVRSDQPRSQRTNSFVPKEMSSSNDSIIGGADGPIAIFIARKSPEELHKRSVCSSLHFSQVSKVEWRLIFYVKDKEDLYLKIDL